MPELVEQRRVFLKAGKAYVPVREQMSMVLAGFTERLDKGLEVNPHTLFNLIPLAALILHTSSLPARSLA